MRVLIVGAGNGGSALLKILHATTTMEIIAIIDENKDARGIQLARENNIFVGYNWKDWIHKDVDIVINATGKGTVLNRLLVETRDKNTIVIPGAVAYLISELFEEKELLLDHIKLEMNNQELILNNIRDGMIVINNQETIQFVNKSAESIVGLPKNAFEGQNIRDVIGNTRLPQILHNRKKEINKKLLLENGKQVIATRIPIINKDNELMGAFSVFKDITEVMNLAEENTDLKAIKTMLEAIFQSSDEAISVVDKNGIGLMINPAYTRITGLRESAVVGSPASTDISEGESMHMKVLRTGKPVRGVPMKLGPRKKDVLVNVAPIIVDKKIEGSVGVIHDVSEIYTLTNELKKAQKIIRTLQAKYTFDDIIGPSPKMNLALEQAKLGAKTPATVLLRGDSGTGKELFAHAIHNESDRKHNKFIRVNCAAIAESILESELFGYEEGAFSGAKQKGKKGLFEEAHMGSIFLDEIGEVSLSMQAKLLRVLQENEIVRVGGTKPITLNVRIIAATNVNLEMAIINKTFREDLYYRLNRLPIFIPPLKDRLTELPELIQHLIEKINQDYGKNIHSITSEALDMLKAYHWPGNIRELENVIGRAMISMGINERKIKKEYIPNLKTIDIKSGNESIDLTKYDGTLKQGVAKFEKQFISDVYRENKFNKTKTAKQLDVSIRNLYYKFEKYNIK